MRAICILSILGLMWRLWRILNNWLYKDALSPFNLLFYFWIAPFFLSLSDLSGLQTGVKLDATVIILASTAVLIATCLLPSTLAVGSALAKFRTLRAARVRPAASIAFYFITVTALYFAEFSDPRFAARRLSARGRFRFKSSYVGQRLEATGYRIWHLLSISILVLSLAE